MIGSSNERSSDVLNRTQYSSDVVVLVVLWRLRYRLTLRNLAEMLLLRGFVFSHEALRDWAAKLQLVLVDKLRHRRHSKGEAGRRSWHVDARHTAGHVGRVLPVPALA